MPTFYKRKCRSRGSWTKADLVTAINEIKPGVKISHIARNLNIPVRTLERRIQNNFSKGRMDRSGVLGQDAEKKLFHHIIKLQKRIFTPTVMCAK